mmetsp:Transcript_55098/g.98313  ORF Transcript_55098/g.98313 Transcript_55098/m.98313 type:complete len:209 (+) Transcript_55098:272-898(+)
MCCREEVKEERGAERSLHTNMRKHVGSPHLSQILLHRGTGGDLADPLCRRYVLHRSFLYHGSHVFNRLFGWPRQWWRTILHDLASPGTCHWCNHRCYVLARHHYACSTRMLGCCGGPGYGYTSCTVRRLQASHRVSPHGDFGSDCVGRYQHCDQAQHLLCPCRRLHSLQLLFWSLHRGASPGFAHRPRDAPHHRAQLADVPGKLGSSL